MRELLEPRAPSCFDFCADKGQDTICELVKICDLDRKNQNKSSVYMMVIYILPMFLRSYHSEFNFLEMFKVCCCVVAGLFLLDRR